MTISLKLFLYELHCLYNHFLQIQGIYKYFNQVSKFVINLPKTPPTLFLQIEQSRDFLLPTLNQKQECDNTITFLFWLFLSLQALLKGGPILLYFNEFETTQFLIGLFTASQLICLFDRLQLLVFIKFANDWIGNWAWWQQKGQLCHKTVQNKKIVIPIKFPLV